MRDKMSNDTTTASGTYSRFRIPASPHVRDVTGQWSRAVITCSDPVQAVNAESITAGIASSFRVTGFGRSIIPRDHTAWERKAT